MSLFTYYNRMRRRYSLNHITSDQQTRMDIFGFLMFLPTLLYLLIFIFTPLLYTFYVSLHQAHLLELSMSFSGFENYRELFSSNSFWQATGKGILYSVFSVSFQMLFGIALALTISKSFKGVSLVRTIGIFPYLVPLISVVIMWKWLLNRTYGAVNQYAVEFGLIAEPIRFFGNPDLALGSIIVVGSWKVSAIVTLVILARLQAIDDTLYEQAKISGASIVQSFRYITLPNLRSAILLLILLRSIWQFNKFSVIWLFTRGGPLSATTTLPVYIYETTFIQYKLGEGSAGAMVLFNLLAIFAVIYFWYFKPSQEISNRS